MTTSNKLNIVAKLENFKKLVASAESLLQQRSFGGLNSAKLDPSVQADMELIEAAATRLVERLKAKVSPPVDEDVWAEIDAAVKALLIEILSAELELTIEEADELRKENSYKTNTAAGTATSKLKR